MIAIDVAAGAHKTPSFSQMNNIGEQQLVDSLRKRPGTEIEQSRQVVVSVETSGEIHPFMPVSHDLP